MADSRILELSQRIAANTVKWNSYLVTSSFPQPSFSVDAPLGVTIPQDNTEMARARQEILNDTLELRELILGPRDHLMGFSENLLVSQQAVARFGLANAFPVGSEISFHDLAAKVGLGETHIRKLVRHAITQKIFTEVRPGVIAHSACSRLIAEDETVSSYLRFKTDDLWHSAFHLCDAVAKWPGSEEPTQTGFAVAHNTEKSMFDYLSENPEKAKYFYKAMRAFAQRPGLEPKHVVDNSAWGSLPQGATVVDVGGSHGIIAIELARAFPSLQLVVQDLDEHIIKDADSKKPADVADRVRFMVHDFLTPQPVRAAVYFFRMIFHNWPDKYCVKILQALIPALEPGARVVINDAVIAEPCTLPWDQEARLRNSDLNMLELQNAGDRELGEWEGIFRQADERFVFKGGSQPEGSRMWILEAEWKG